jgi:hypothetical protein
MIAFWMKRKPTPTWIVNVTQCSKLWQHLTFLSPTNSNPGTYKQILMNTDKSRKIQKNTEYPQNHQKQHIIRKAKNI